MSTTCFDENTLRETSDFQYDDATMDIESDTILAHLIDESGGKTSDLDIDFVMQYTDLPRYFWKYDLVKSIDGRGYKNGIGNVYDVAHGTYPCDVGAFCMKLL